MPIDDVQRNHYEQKCRIAFLEKRGDSFQAWFADLAGYAWGADFEPARPYGNLGDLKCDGRRLSTRTIFQCYAPRSMSPSELIPKINRDFGGAREHWDGWMMQWVLVHNDPDALPAPALRDIDQLRQEHPEIEIEIWGYPKLKDLKDGLPLECLEALFGFAPSRLYSESLVMDDIKPVIDRLQELEPVPGQEPLTPPSAEKLERNSLSPEARSLLRIGRRKESLVRTYFRKAPRPDLGERIAEHFRNRYSALRADGLCPDRIFAELQYYAGGTPTSAPRQQGAALAVLSYFFERCDIFEDPEGIA